MLIINVLYVLLKTCFGKKDFLENMYILYNFTSESLTKKDTYEKDFIYVVYAVFNYWLC